MTGLCAYFAKSKTVSPYKAPPPALISCRVVYRDHSELTYWLRLYLSSLVQVDLGLHLELLIEADFAIL